MRIGIADTTFARADMAAWALDELRGVETERYTVPGVKDLALAAKRLARTCDAVLALGWVGGQPIDETCAHEANIALAQAELMADKHVLKVFVHESEGGDLLRLAEDRVRKHARNALALVEGTLGEDAGRGKRQGMPDAGRLS